MAGADYLDCYVCGRRMFYDPNYELEGWLDEKGEAIVCLSCYNKMKNEVEAHKTRSDDGNGHQNTETSAQA